jgi:hypothetical protein
MMAKSMNFKKYFHLAERATLMRSPSLAITNMIQLESNESQPISLENVEITKITDGDLNVSSCHLDVI